MNSKARVAFVVDALPAVGGGEKTLFAALDVFPQADIFTLIYNKKLFGNTPIANRKVITSAMDRLPFARSHHRLFLPLMPAAVERFDLRQYDVVVAFSYAVAHGVHTGTGTHLLSYTYTPMRYAWSDMNIDGKRSRKHPLLNWLMENFRRWDRSAAGRVHEFAAISHGVAERIKSAYQREARLIYPPVEVERFCAGGERRDYFVTLSRLVPHKRIDLIVEAFSQLQFPLKIVGEGPESKKLQQRSAPNIEFLGYQSDEAVAGILEHARGFVCAAEEDFGIAIVEAQAAGCPVLAYKAGGALETVIEGETGVFFPEQSTLSLIEAVRQFEVSARDFRPEAMSQNAQKFSKIRFQKSFHNFVQR